MANINNHASKSNPEFRDQTTTPTWLYEAFNAEFSFTLDAAATRRSAKCPVFFTTEMNSLKQCWKTATLNARNPAVWVNPPYSDIRPWMLKAKEEQTYVRKNKLLKIGFDIVKSLKEKTAA